MVPKLFIQSPIYPISRELKSVSTISRTASKVQDTPKYNDKADTEKKFYQFKKHFFKLYIISNLCSILGYSWLGQTFGLFLTTAKQHNKGIALTIPYTIKYFSISSTDFTI